MQKRVFVKNPQRDNSNASDKARAMTAAKRALALERARLYGPSYNGPFQVPNTGRSRLMEHKTFDYNPTGSNSVIMYSGTDVNPAVTPFAPVTGASAGCINQVPIGNSSITRVGRRMNITAVAIRGQLYSSTSTPAAKATLMLIWDRHPNKAAALPAWNTILTSQSPDSLTNKDYAPRFKILRRWDFCIIGAGTAGSPLNPNSVQLVDEFVKLKNKVTIWDAADTTGIVTDMIEGALYLYFVSDETDASGNAPKGIFNTRIYFQDS